MIQADKLSKMFKRTVNEDEKGKGKKTKKTQDFYAVNKLSIKANSGEILGILGPNGAGKTTLLRMLAKLMEPTEGSVSITDEQGNYITDTKQIKEHIGYLSGNTKLYNRFSIREMLGIFADIYGISKDEAEKRIEEINKVLNLEKFIDNRIERLSTGQTQRANIARCLIHNPDIYIFDEPTLGLDILSSEAIIEFMKTEREKGKTILYSTHYMEEAQYLCDRIVFIHEGRLIQEGKPGDIMKITDTENLREAFKKLAL